MGRQHGQPQITVWAGGRQRQRRLHASEQRGGWPAEIGSGRHRSAASLVQTYAPILTFLALTIHEHLPDEEFRKTSVAAIDWRGYDDLASQCDADLHGDPP